MNTDHLADLFIANLKRVERVQFRSALLVAMLNGGAAVFVVMLATVCPRVDLSSTAHLEARLVKLLFAVSVIATAAPQLLRSLRLGLEQQRNRAVLLLPCLAATVNLAILLVVTPRAGAVMLRGATSALRQDTRTRLRLCGVIPGVVAGGFGAAAYALNCRSDTIPFIAVCYGVAIAFCALIGAQIRPRLLGW
jgi:hypothetical protein